VRSGSYEMTHLLVTQGAWVEQICRKRWTAMHEAAKVGNSDIVMLLLRNGGRVNQKDITGATPLAVAAEHGHFHIIEILVNCGHKVNSQACNGESVLSDAAGSGNLACIKFLLDNGANPNLHSATGHLPIHKAAYAGHYDALKLLIPLTHKKAIKEAGQSPVHSATEGGHSRCLKLLLASGFDVNYRMNTRNSENYRDMRRSALYFAVSNGDTECTRVLLAAGAKTDLDPLCSLLVAVRSGRYEIVKLLLAAKADVNCYFNVVSDTVFPTALQYCLKDEMMMRLLLNNGYKVETCFQCHHDSGPSEPYEREEKIPVSENFPLFPLQFCEFMSLCCIVHLSGRVVLTLLDYVKHIHICSTLRLILEKQKEWPEICCIQRESLCVVNFITVFLFNVKPAEDSDDEALLDAQVQLLIQESCQAHHRARPSSRLEPVKYLHVFLKCLFFCLVASCRLTLEETTVEGETFLTSAVNAGLVDNVKMLLKHGASPHTTNSRNESPLLLGSRKMVATVLNGGARVGQVCLKKWTAMHEAAMTGYAHIMELLLSNGGKVTDTDQHGVTPLGIAAEYSRAEVLEILIKNGADVNAQAPNGDSVLYDATGSGNPDCVNILLEHGANPNMHNLSFQLPIHKAAYEGHYLALRTLMPLTTRRALRLAGQSPVHSAADGGHAHCLELLLQNGYDVNALLAPHVSENYGDMRRSPLYFAVCNGDRTCTELLLNSGAQPDLDPLSCLLVAVRSGRYEIVKLLLAAKADVNCYFTAVTDTVFPTALLYCLKDEVMMRLLLNQGLDAEKCFCCSHDDSWDDHVEYSHDQEEKATFCDFVSLSWLVNLAGRVVSILLDYVGQVSLCNKLVKILENQKEWSQIQEII
ncbi:hypothetical protein NL108_014337, partial [Boleophthalmus pectinirostris]